MKVVWTEMNPPFQPILDLRNVPSIFGIPRWPFCIEHLLYVTLDEAILSDKEVCLLMTEGSLFHWTQPQGDDQAWAAVQTATITEKVW